MDKRELAQYMDHTFLKAFATEQDLIDTCNEAMAVGAKMVAINSYWTRFCRTYLDAHQSKVHVGAAIGFPLGQQTIEVKVFETKNAIKNGADEIDYVLNISKVKDGDFNYIEDEMQQIVDVCKHQGIISKVIFENCYLTKEEIIKCAQVANVVKPDFIKTSTGFGTGGATLEDVQLMLEHAPNVQVKAAGQVRSYDVAKSFIDLGVKRIGTSSTLKILEEFEQQTP